MTAYTACFRGRLIGAIGKMSYFNVNIEAENTDSARLKLYDTHEHIFGLFWLWPGKQTVCKHKPRYKKEFYVSTYHDGSWRQTDCDADEVEVVKAKHLVDLGLN